MTIARRTSRSPRLLAYALALLLALSQTSACAEVDEPLPTEEVAAELAELAVAITPFTVQYDAASKSLVFKEVIESTDKALSDRIGELRARLDRMDVKRMNYTPSTAPYVMTIRGKPLAGSMNFYCLSGERCVRRGIRETATAAFVGEETPELGFSIDVIGDSVIINQLQRFAALVRHLITISSGG